MKGRFWVLPSLWLLGAAGCAGGGEAGALVEHAAAMAPSGIGGTDAMAPSVISGATPPSPTPSGKTTETPASPAAAGAEASQICQVVAPAAVLPDEVRETSGLAQSRLDPHLFWTHNDKGGGPEIFGIDDDGRLVRRVRIAGAESVDWEDIEAGSCEAGACLYVGDIGDNDAERDRITIYRVQEPEDGTSQSAPAVALHARFTEGAQDAESLFRLATGDLYLVTKGRQGPIALYRYPAPERPGETVTLERVRELFPEPAGEEDRVTSATASPDGRWVGIRSYRNLYLYRAEELVGDGQAEPIVVDLAPLGQVQGESVAISADGTVWLSTEAENEDASPAWARLRCTFPR